MYSFLTSPRPRTLSLDSKFLEGKDGVQMSRCQSATENGKMKTVEAPKPLTELQLETKLKPEFIRLLFF